MPLHVLSGLSPMLLARAEHLDAAPGVVMEPKWDGFRCLVAHDGGEIRMRSRHGTDLSGAAPAVARDLLRLLPTGPVLDGELVALVPGRGGRVEQHFGLLRSAVFSRRPSEALSLVVWDVLFDAGLDVRLQPWMERRARLERLVPDRAGAAVLRSPTYTPGAGTFASLVGAGFEGVVLKRIASLYRCGVRSRDWRKLKARHELAGEVLGVGQSRPGEAPRALVRLEDGTRCWVLAFTRSDVGEAVTVRYARRDPDGQPRDARIVAGSNRSAPVDRSSIRPRDPSRPAIGSRS